MGKAPYRTIGAMLKTRRKAKGWTLRDAENLTRISNGYLSLLESDKIKSPSPTYLAKLADAFELSYASLMHAAGYREFPEAEVQNNEFAQRILDEPQATLSSGTALNNVSAASRGLTRHELAQVEAFIEGLKAARHSVAAGDSSETSSRRSASGRRRKAD